MPNLLSFRPWTLQDWNPEAISQLKNPERKPDDRSPFVRYARAAALWAEWTREGTVVQEHESSFPNVEMGGIEFKFALTRIQSLRPLVSVPPSAKEHYQRLLEGTQVYIDPIIVVPFGDGYQVVGNHEVFEAAKAYQSDLARPGKIRSSDYCLVAIADEKLLDSVQVRKLTFDSKKTDEDIVNDLLRAKYVLSPRADAPDSIRVEIGDKILVKTPESGGAWKQTLAAAIGAKSLDISSKPNDSGSNVSGKKIVLASPKMSRNVLEIGTEYPFGSVYTEIAPLSGVKMWSLRDFSN
ncbi:MAG: hypothetical protein JST12_19830 [Armatimonadetes bacterium]|nr:hypothetical protein [Armatimonadota bacterium]